MKYKAMAEPESGKGKLYSLTRYSGGTFHVICEFVTRRELRKIVDMLRIRFSQVEFS